MDYLINPSFSKDLHGNIIFYRFGFFTKYYILPNAKKEAEIRSFIKRYYMISLGAFIAMSVVWGLMYGFLLIPVSLLWYYFETKQLLQGLKKQL